MSVRDSRRAPFCWLSLAALEAITYGAAERHVAGLRNTYLALAQVAARSHDGHHDGFEATLAELAKTAHVDRATIKRHLPMLAELGLIHVERREAANGGTLPSAYVLLEPGQPAPAPSAEPPVHDAPPPVHHAPPGVHEAARHAPPSRARRTAAKKEETQQLPPTPRAPLAGQPLEEEGSRMLEVTTREHATRQPCGSCGAEPGRPCIGNRGQERESLHASRHAAAIAAGAPVLAPQERGGRPRARRRGSREQGTNPRALGTNPRARTGPPPEPPTAALIDAWHKIHAELEHAATASAWALYLEPLKLAGTRGTELVLHAPPGRGSWTGDQFGRLLTAAARAHLGAVTTVAVLEAEAVAA